MSAPVSLVLMQNARETGLTIDEMIDSLPTDPGSIVAIALVLAFGVGVVYFGTRGGPRKPPTAGEPPTSGHGDSPR